MLAPSVFRCLLGGLAVSFRARGSTAMGAGVQSCLTPVRRMAGVTTVERGTPNSENYRIYFKRGDVAISPMHDIPLFFDEQKNIMNMVVEIPRWTNAKMEIATKERLNPIKQDTKKGKLRYVSNLFPHKGYIWNYGALPQTWEDPGKTDHHTGHIGDNDPIDVCELGSKVARRGEVIQVKILGVVGLVDEGETDWKILAINVEDPLADKMNDVEDIEIQMPGYLHATIEWLRNYKIPDGKPANQFALNGEAKNRQFALDIISETRNHWKALLADSVDTHGIDIHSSTVDSAARKLTHQQASSIIDESAQLTAPASVPSGVDNVFFMKP